MSKPCTWCHKLGHTQFYCQDKPRTPIKRSKELKPSRKPIRFESPKNYARRVATYKKWIALNPPDSYGYWTCYLQISQLCLKRVTVQTLTLEHVQPKTKRPDLKFDVTNIRSSCAPCNKLKSRQTLEQLVKSWPHLSVYL